MYHFPEPKPRIKFSPMNAKEFELSGNILEAFPIHSVHFLSPGSNDYKKKCEDMLLTDENIYFIVKDVTASCFIQRALVENFVNSGSLLAVTNNSRVEVENFLSIVPPGKLVLSLEKSIAQSLALHKEGHQKKKKRRRNFETIIIDLTCPDLIPGKKYYEFISFELSKINFLKFSLLLKWKPSGNACPQSLKSYFVSEGYECIVCKPRCKSLSKFPAPVPKINFEMTDTDILDDILEWAGVQICGIQYTTEEDEYVSKLTVPETFDHQCALHKSSFEGFYSKADILPVIKELSKIFEKDASLKYIAVCISGFQDAFVQANGFQFFSFDDKLIYIIIFPSFNYWIITLNCR